MNDFQTYVVEILEEVRKDIGEMKITLALNTQSLEKHIKRTDLLEKQVSMLDKDVTKLRGFFSVLGWIVGVGATILTVLEKFGKL